VEVLNDMGTLDRIRGDLDRSEALHRQALELAREIRSSWAEAHALAGLGRCALAAGNLIDGESALRQALEIRQQPGESLRGLTFYRTGSLEEAGRLAEADPAVQAGRLVIEIMTWYCPPGTMSKPGRSVSL
jgi:tetratricopeptide (TPR) repeat protein